MYSFGFSVLTVSFVLWQCGVYSEIRIMPDQTVPITLSTVEDFEKNLNGFLTPTTKLALFLDYDGTLADITIHPEFTEMSPETEKALRRLTELPNIFVSVISGRGLGDVKSKVPISNITFGGNHGFEIECTDGTRLDYEIPQEIKDNYRKLVDDVKKNFQFEGTWTEDKRVSMTYHYREAEGKISDAFLQKLKETIQSYGFRANQAKSAIEAKPPINWNKGEAALLLLKRNFGDDWKDNIKAIFAGDDITDEDGMRVLKGVGRTFRISTNPTIQTIADYRLPSTEQVTLLLKWIEKQYK